MTLSGQKKRDYQKQWRLNRRQEFFRDKLCVHCGSKTNLELHHSDPMQKIDHEIWSWSSQRRTEELKKCIILCKTCHKKWHKEFGRHHPLIHGTSNMYGTRKCRCEICKASHAKYSRDYKRMRQQ
jgi:hypothetical protein